MRRTLLIGILLVALALRVAWAVVLPFNDGPDEMRHMRTITFFSDHGLPTREDIFSGAYGFYIATSPLPYVGQLVVDAVWKAIGQVHAPVFALRLVSVFWGTLLVAQAAWLMRRWRPELALWLAALLAVHPQLVFQSAYVNWDILTFVIASAIVSCWPALLVGRVQPLRVGALAGACLLCKPTGFAVLPVLLAVFVYAQRADLLALLKNGALAALSCSLVALPFLVRNNQVLPGDPFGFHTVLGTVATDWEASVPGGWAQLWTSRWLINSFESAWAVFGHLQRKVHNALYVVFAALSVTALVGWVRARRFDVLTWAFLASVAMSVLLSYITSAINDYQPYGRYLFASVLPLLSLFVAGLASVHKQLLPLTIALLLVVSVVYAF